MAMLGDLGEYVPKHGETFEDPTLLSASTAEAFLDEWGQDALPVQSVALALMLDRIAVDVIRAISGMPEGVCKDAYTQHLQKGE